MPMPNDPYASEARYNLASVASNIFAITPSGNDIAKGVKGLRIFNTLGTVVSFRMLAVNSDADVTLKVPGNACLDVPVRAQRIYDTSPAPTGLEFHGYSD